MLRLRYERLQRELTLAQVAAAARVDAGSLSRLERGRQLPYSAWVRRLSGFYGVPGAVLFAEIEIPVADETRDAS